MCKKEKFEQCCRIEEKGRTLYAIHGFAKLVEYNNDSACMHASPKGKGKIKKHGKYLCLYVKRSGMQ